MNNSHIDALLRAVEILGGNAALARKLGVSRVTVGQWLNRGPAARDVPPKRCVCIEAITRGAVTRRELRPGDWADIWPELVESNLKSAQSPASIAPAATETVAQGVAHG